MGGVIRFLVFLAVSLTIMALLVVQLLVPAIVTAAVRAEIPVSATPVAVDVRTSLVGVLLEGRIDSIRVSSSNVRRGLVTAAAIDVTATDVGIVDHSFASVTGTLSGVTLDEGIRPPLRLSRVRLTGGPTGIEADGTLTPADLEVELESALAGAGTDPVLAAAHITFSDGVIHVSTGTIEGTASLRLVDGAIVLDGGSLGTLTLAAPPSDGSWRVTSVTLTSDGAEITAEVPVGADLVPGLSAPSGASPSGASPSGVGASE